MSSQGSSASWRTFRGGSRNAITSLESEMAALAGSMLSNWVKVQQVWQKTKERFRRIPEMLVQGMEKLKDAQEELNSKSKELLEKINQMARSLGKFNENAMEDLLQSSRESKESGLERSGKRAANFLLYENFPMAEKEEGKVAENLEKLEGDLDGVADKLKNLGNQALRDLVENLMQVFKEDSTWDGSPRNEG